MPTNDVNIYDLLSAEDIAIERENLKTYLALLFGQLEQKDVVVKYIKVGPSARDLFVKCFPEALQDAVPGTEVIGSLWGAIIIFDPAFKSIAVYSEHEFQSRAEMVFGTKG